MIGEYEIVISVIMLIGIGILGLAVYGAKVFFNK